MNHTSHVTLMHFYLEAATCEVSINIAKKHDDDYC